MKEKLKSYLLNDQIFYGILVILVGFLSFILGQKSVQDSTSLSQSRVEFIESKPIQRIEATTNNSNLEPTKESMAKNSPDGQIVASKNGTRYYYNTCATVKRIKPENLITFPNIEAAKAAGYTKALNCP